QTASVHPEPGSNSPCWIVFLAPSSYLCAILTSLSNSSLFTLTFYFLFVILSISNAYTLYLDSFDEVNRALSFQTIFFSRFSAPFGESLLFWRFINISTIPRVVKRFCQNILIIF
ncbi:hypothetical protein, partial [Microcoleus sp. herbarium14]|uniref:hypothetical protein n=1 Tax=Microcoleus sp. herbarium14 TaxID=3055439 RepID=UPI002FD49374